MINKTVVVIDDDPDDLDIIKEALTNVDSTIHCMTFVHPEEAVRVLGKDHIFSPDYIFIDINMPRLTGHECLRALRKVSELKEAKIIMFSTSMPPEVIETVKSNGANYAFQKPYSVREYFHILETIFYNS